MYSKYHTTATRTSRTQTVLIRTRTLIKNHVSNVINSQINNKTLTPLPTPVITLVVITKAKNPGRILPMIKTNVTNKFANSVANQAIHRLIVTLGRGKTTIRPHKINHKTDHKLISLNK